MKEGSSLGERIHVWMRNHGQWGFMEELWKVDEKMREKFAKEEVVDL